MEKILKEKDKHGLLTAQNIFSYKIEQHQSYLIFQFCKKKRTASSSYGLFFVCFAIAITSRVAFKFIFFSFSSFFELLLSFVFHFDMIIGYSCLHFGLQLSCMVK